MIAEPAQKSQQAGAAADDVRLHSPSPTTNRADGGIVGGTTPGARDCDIPSPARTPIRFATAPVQPIAQDASEILESLERRRDLRFSFTRNTDSKVRSWYVRPQNRAVHDTAKAYIDRRLKRSGLLCWVNCGLTLLCVIAAPISMDLSTPTVFISDSLIMVASFLTLCGVGLANDKLRILQQSYEAADATETAQEVATHVAGDAELSARWEGLLRHTEEASVPILNGDVDGILSQAAREKEVVAVAVTPWRMVDLPTGSLVRTDETPPSATRGDFGFKPFGLSP